MNNTYQPGDSAICDECKIGPAMKWGGNMKCFECATGVAVTLPEKVSANDKEKFQQKFMANAERRVTDPDTGGQKGQKLARYDLLPVDAMWQVAELYGRGANKYAERNWEKGYSWSLSYAAMMRHANLFWGGESYDKETGAHHLASVVFHALAMITFEQTHPEKDDRPKNSQQGTKHFQADECICDKLTCVCR